MRETRSVRRGLSDRARAGLLLGLLVGLLLGPAPSLAEGAWFGNGTVREVRDGDSLTLQTGDGERIELRLYGVDCPERAWPGRWSAQAGSEAAYEFTRRFALNRAVTIRFTGDLTRGRAVGEVFVDGRSLSRELLRAGHAWWDRRRAGWDHDLKRLESGAHGKGRGLWKEEKVLPPWEHRKQAK